MKQRHFLLVIAVLLLAGTQTSYAQMVSDNVFLQAAHVEVGISQLGSFGSSRPAPTGYHPCYAMAGGPGYAVTTTWGSCQLWSAASAAGSSNRLLGFVADPAGDGWATGAPTFFGDYFLPGTPQEGWSIQVNGVESDAYTNALNTYGTATTGYTGTLSGTNVSYSHVAGVSYGVWQGQTTDPLLITQTTRLDTSKYYFTIHVTIKNTGATTASNVYYQRTLDPDNAEAQYGAGDFTTINTINYALPSAGNKVMVSAVSATNPLAFMGLGTKDCRAQAYIMNGGLFPAYPLDELYTGTSTDYFYGTGTTNTSDEGIGLVYKLGNIAPGDSTDLTYAYVLRAADLDSALDATVPTAVANSTLLLPGSDTVNACAAGADSIPININNGNAYTWVWAPATGLTATTGTTSTAVISLINTITTYTIIGTPISAGLCINDTFYFTITTCNLASNNSPCVGDTLKLFALGDTAGATYYWHGPGGFTSNLQNPFIFPASFANSGIYTVVKTVGTAADSTTTTVVITQPAAPGVTGNVPYCQFIGPYIPVTVLTYAGATPLWYTFPAGGTGLPAEPAPNLNYPGSTTYYVSQLDSTCESPRTPVTVVVNPKPNPPVVVPPVYCVNYYPALPLSATGGAGSSLTWYGQGIPPTGTSTPPIPATNVVGNTDSFYVTQTILGCISDSALDVPTILPLPTPPLTTDTTYCQFAPTVPLTAVGANLEWYFNGVRVDSTPVPPTDVYGVKTWYVTQSITTLGVTCQSDSTPLHVTTIYLPDFTIVPSHPYVCQYDSINLAYTGTGVTLANPAYTWVLPEGAHVVDGTTITGMPNIVVQFDSATQNNYVYLTASDDFGRCSTTDTIRIKVVSQPDAKAFTKVDVCIGDTTNLSLASSTADASDFVWHIDGTLLANSTALNIVSYDDNSGGPFVIYWNDSGSHVIQLNSYTQEGCASVPEFDSIYVHPLPDARFTYKPSSGALCLQDSVLFTANSVNYNFLYLWQPARFFNNINEPSEWGLMDQAQSDVTLTVTDEFGCAASTMLELDPTSCCSVGFPSAFTPNGDHNNDVFKPIFAGYHLFHTFRIANRWGQTIFESSNSNNMEWDGTFNGVPQDMGIYYYYIKFDCGNGTVEQKGDVTLIR